MSDDRMKRGVRGRRGRLLGRVAVGAVVATTAYGALLVDASAASPPVLQSSNVTAYPGVLANSSGRTLYVLSTEKSATIHCVRKCLTIWPPLLER